MSKTKKLTSVFLSLVLQIFSLSCQENQSSSHLISKDSLSILLDKPDCLHSFSEDGSTYTIEKLRIESSGIHLTGWLYQPKSEGRHPLVIIISGGFNEEDLIMQAPLYDAPRLAHCGISAFIYNKRGTGESEGKYQNSSYDDFINDAGNIALFLSKHDDIDSNKIGVMGGSSGGRFAPLAAARFPIFSFVISNAGPVVSMSEGANYNIKYALSVRGYSDSLISLVMPLWRRHHAAWENNDSTELKYVAEEIIEMRKYYDPLLLPSTYKEVETDTNLNFLKPTFISASKDYLTELKNLKVKWLSIYGELDRIVPVEPSINNIKRLMTESGNKQYGIIVIKETNHSFINSYTRVQTPVIYIIINWLKYILKQ